jgi:hypothetical protein
VASWVNTLSGEYMNTQGSCGGPLPPITATTSNKNEAMSNNIGATLEKKQFIHVGI